ncbi:efflux transporter outer membrane subunit [Viridibacterium curvum]|uniref:Efflux transporter outer membrane subunit n=2 Tax=Viridibacterium curvum TaxID=1101404 RepID=A0ABP9QCF8_9RHOO
MVGPDYNKPADPATPAWHNTSALPAADIALATWWQQFHDPLLDQLVKQALEGSLTLQSAEAKLREARARRGLQFAQVMPTSSVGLGGNRSETRTDNKRSDSHGYSADIDASWEIDFFGGRQRAIEAADATLNAAGYDLAAARVSLAAEVANNYIALRAAQQRLAVTKQSVISREQTLQLTRWRFEAKLVSSLELNQALSSLEQARAALPTLERTIEESKIALAVLLGKPRSAVEALLQADGDLPVAPAALAQRLPADALRQRPDVQAAERRLAAQTAQIGVAEAARYPSLKLSGQIGVEALTPAGLLRADTIVSSLVGSLTAPLFDAGRVQRNVEIQTALRDQTLASYRSTLLQALADSEKALSAIRWNAQRVEAQQRAADAASEAARLALINNRAGRSDLLTLLDAQRTELSQQDALSSARGDYLTAIVQLYKALGGGWSPAQDGDTK